MNNPNTVRATEITADLAFLVDHAPKADRKLAGARRHALKRQHLDALKAARRENRG